MKTVSRRALTLLLVSLLSLGIALAGPTGPTDPGPDRPPVKTSR